MGFRFVKLQFTNEMKSLDDIRKELDNCLKTAEDALELADSIKNEKLEVSTRGDNDENNNNGGKIECYYSVMMIY